MWCCKNQLNPYWLVLVLLFSSCIVAASSKWNLLRSNKDSIESSQTGHSVNSKRVKKAPDSPLIIVPGLGGSRLYANLNKQQSVNSFCQKHVQNTRLWPPLLSFLPRLSECWLDNIGLHYDSATSEFREPPGVNVSVPGFGHTIANEYLMDIRLSALQYFRRIVKSAISWGHKRNISIRSAPYDFRKALTPSYHADYSNRLMQLISETYRINGQRKVTLLCHSLGCLVSLHFLQQKMFFAEKYIRRFVVLGAPFGGSLDSTKAILSGTNWGINFLDNLDIREVERSWPCMHVLQPRDWLNRQALNQQSQPVVYTPTKNYTIRQLKRLYDDINPQMWKVFEASNKIYNPLEAPNIETYCVTGTKIPTAQALIYNGKRYQKTDHSFPDGQPSSMVYGDGDGTVLQSSMDQICRHWSHQQSEPVHYKEFPKAGHMGMLNDDRVIDYLKSIIAPSFEPLDETLNGELQLPELAIDPTLSGLI